MAVIKISRNLQVKVLLLGLLSLLYEAVVAGLDYLDLSEQLNWIDCCFVIGFTVFAAELPWRECIYGSTDFFEAAPAIDMTWIFLLLCAWSFNLNHYALGTLFLKKFRINLKCTLTNGFFWICFVHFVILLHFINNLTPMHDLLFLSWFRLLSFEAAFPLLYTDHLQYRQHHLFLFFFEQLWSLLLFFLIFSIESHINLFSLPIFYDLFDVQLSFFVLLCAFKWIFDDIQRRVELQLIFLNIFLDFDTIADRYVLPFINFFLCCIDQLLQPIDIPIFQFRLDILHLHLCQCHLKLLIFLLHIISRIHFLDRSVFPQE